MCHWCAIYLGTCNLELSVYRRDVIEFSCMFVFTCIGLFVLMDFRSSMD